MVGNIQTAIHIIHELAALLDLEEAEGHRRRFKYRNTLREQVSWADILVL